VTDPRNTVPRYSDPRPDTGVSHGESVSGHLGWIVAIAAVVLIAFAVFAVIKHGIDILGRPQLMMSPPAQPSLPARPMSDAFESNGRRL
jgi:hypothetical protein